MTPPPPTSPLFPYTTLFRSRRATVPAGHVNLDLRILRRRHGEGVRRAGAPLDEQAVLAVGGVGRSEEHTSELQSRGHLVCRLLLEKKKQTQETRSLSHK